MRPPRDSRHRRSCPPRHPPHSPERRAGRPDRHPGPRRLHGSGGCRLECRRHRRPGPGSHRSRRALLGRRRRPAPDHRRHHRRDHPAPPGGHRRGMDLAELPDALVHPQRNPRSLQPGAEDPRRHPQRPPPDSRPRPRRPHHRRGRHIPPPGRQVRLPARRGSSASGRRHLRLTRGGTGGLREGPRGRDVPRPGAPDRHRTRRHRSAFRLRRHHSQARTVPPGDGGRPPLPGRCRSPTGMVPVVPAAVRIAGAWPCRRGGSRQGRGRRMG